jgi:hypothetical protein
LGDLVGRARGSICRDFSARWATEMLRGPGLRRRFITGPRLVSTDPRLRLRSRRTMARRKASRSPARRPAYVQDPVLIGRVLRRAGHAPPCSLHGEDRAVQRAAAVALPAAGCVSRAPGEADTEALDGSLWRPERRSSRRRSPAPHTSGVTRCPSSGGCSSRSWHRSCRMRPRLPTIRSRS